jgi:hypothetical protein
MQDTTRIPTPARPTAPSNFDMVRLGKSKRACDVCSNTIRAYGEQGLNIYRVGKAAFFSKAELEQFIRAKASPFVKARTLAQ